MHNKDIPETFFNMLPLPIAITKPMADNPNSPIVFINQHFIKIIGWELTDIPDKKTWWQKVYPDEHYAKVIERQWELAMTTAAETTQGYVSLDMNIETKYHGEKRFKAYTQIDSQLIPGYYVVAFQPL